MRSPHISLTHPNSLAQSAYKSWPLILILLLAALATRPAPASPIDSPQARCASLQTANFASLRDAPTQITWVTPVDAKDGTPAHCEVRGYVAPSVGIRVVLPVSWNGKLVNVGCGGHCGIVDDQYLPMACKDVLRKGYACLASDMGHVGAGLDGLWANDNLQAKIDWGFRATHVAALASKAIAAQYYGKAASKAYFLGCSTGGRQGLQEAQLFPWDFDGIVAGAPPTNLPAIYMTFAWGIRATRDDTGRQLLGKADLKLLSDAATARCDLDDGIRDGIISDPLNCSFKPSDLKCKPGQSNSCLTPAQVEAATKVYAGPMNSRGVQITRGGPLVGSELGGDSPYTGWRSYLEIEGMPAIYERLAADGFRFLFFSPDAGANWNLNDFNFDDDYKRFGVAQVLYRSNSPDLQQFKDAGGKLLVFQGLNDNSVLPRDTIDYYEKTERTMGGRDATGSFFRLFVLPGVGHCAGGPGADTVDYLSAIEAWVEDGRAPDQLIAAHVDTPPNAQPFWLAADPAKTVFTRPVYPYPAKARYKGVGNPKDASSFERVPR